MEKSVSPSTKGEKGSGSIGPYKLGHTLGMGAFGKVVEGYDNSSGLKVAIKFLAKTKLLDLEEVITK